MSLYSISTLTKLINHQFCKQLVRSTQSNSLVQNQLRSFSIASYRLSNLKFTDKHEWIRIDGKIGTIGITDYAQVI